jgi:uncharacterized membrane protein YhaH (DUF805 family)
MLCKTCGKEVDSSLEFCGSCGAAISSDARINPYAPPKSSVDPPAAQTKGVFWYVEVLKKYAVFTGRARRKEYWMFTLFNVLIVIVLSLIEGITGLASNGEASILTGVYQLGILVPSIAVGVRRMHDTNHSGWWILCPIVNLIFALIDGTRGENRFGPDPKFVAS